MTLFQQIQKKLTNISHKTLIKDMGYHNVEVGLKTLQSLLDKQNIYLWLKDGHFDFRYSGEEFVKKLCFNLEIKKTTYETLLNNYSQRKKDINLQDSSYIYINTNFKRKNEPIFALALMEKTRRINLDTELLFDMNLEQALSYVSYIIKIHYKENEGKLTLWGHIETYIFHYKNQDSIVLDTNGHITKNIYEASVSRAIIKINNKLLF